MGVEIFLEVQYGLGDSYIIYKQAIEIYPINEAYITLAVK